MIKNYFLLLALVSLLLNSKTSFAQSVEDFEGESGGSSTFTNNSQLFTVTSNTGESYNVFTDGYMDNGSTDTCTNCGWNGSGTDQKFLDNSGAANNNGDNNGSSFTITTGGVEIGVTSLYLFCSTNAIGSHSGTVSIVGKRGGVTQYTITKSSGFANVTTFTPNNGFTFIDFATEGSSDFTQHPIDELEFTSTGNLDYMALDGFSWAPGATLSSNNYDLSRVEVFPNPTSDYLMIKGLSEDYNYSIYNLIGARVLSGVVKPGDKIDVSLLAKGMYLLKLKEETSIKFIKR